MSVTLLSVITLIIFILRRNKAYETSKYDPKTVSKRSFGNRTISLRNHEFHKEYMEGNLYRNLWSVWFKKMFLFLFRIFISFPKQISTFFFFFFHYFVYKYLKTKIKIKQCDVFVIKSENKYIFLKPNKPLYLKSTKFFISRLIHGKY